jgi:hypothetical protein
MSTEEKWVTTTEAFVAAANDRSVKRVVISGRLANAPSIRLSPGQSLCGAADESTITFSLDSDGVQLSSDNGVHNLHLEVSPEKRAVFNDTAVVALGRIELHSLTTTGSVQILARDKVRAGHIEVNGLDIVAADTRAQNERPQGYGVHVLQGAFTLWNMQTGEDVAIGADLVDISVGRNGAPVRGGGIFVGGAGDRGGRLNVRRLETGAVYSDGGSPAGTPDCISGGVFVVYGAYADLVRNRGPVTTYGANDMVLDNWGMVDRWLAEEKITSHGPSGIGFVNFGTINILSMNAPIETFGQGARGFNVYAGTVGVVDFDRVVTHADGAVGVQVSQPVGEIKVRRGIETFGGKGQSLVKGVVMNLSASALSVKPGGSIERAQILGGLMTHGAGVEAIELHGRIGVLEIGRAEVAGGGFDKI